MYEYTQEDMQKTLRTLPLNTFEEIPKPKADAKKITGLIKKGGRIVGYQLEDGSNLTKEAAVEAARRGGIKGVGIARRKDTQYLRALPDGKENNNLSSLPTVNN